MAERESTRRGVVVCCLVVSRATQFILQLTKFRLFSGWLSETTLAHEPEDEVASINLTKTNKPPTALRGLQKSSPMTAKYSHEWLHTKIARGDRR
jgi:hypothetical protein